MRRSDIRYLRSLPHHAHSSKPTKFSVCILAGNSLRRPSANVWLVLKRWSFRLHRRYASRYIWPCGLQSHPQMGRRLSSHPSPPPILVRIRIHRPDSILWCSMESREASCICDGPALHWLQLEPRQKISSNPGRENFQNSGAIGHLARAWCKVLVRRNKQHAWKASTHLLRFSHDPPFPACPVYLRINLSIPTGKAIPVLQYCQRPLLGCRPPAASTERDCSLFSTPCGHRMVGRCQYVLRHRRSHRSILGRLAMGTRFSGGSKSGFRYRMGQSCCCRIRASPGLTPWL
ncbi:hypothetical protein F4604DRAFT_1653768, partial [Suillus subluteus]